MTESQKQARTLKIPETNTFGFKFDTTKWQKAKEAKEQNKRLVKVSSHVGFDGTLDIKFSEPVKPKSDKQGRRLDSQVFAEASKFETKTEVDGETVTLGIEFELVEQTNEKMTYKMRFSDPLALSQGESPDVLGIQISLSDVLDFAQMSDLLLDEQLNTDVPIPRQVTSKEQYE